MSLKRFKDARRAELARLREDMPAPLMGRRPDFRAALMAATPAGFPLHVIAEFKRRSPSAGLINGRLSPAEVARQYAAGGATCMSVLTEQAHFRGQLRDLAAAAPAGLPLLRKDFIFDELQVYQTLSTPASALLLVVALTPCVAKLRALRELAECCGLHAVVEVFTEKELDIARASGAHIIQVNARNLATFVTDRAAPLRLAALRQPDECWIAASAMSDPAHLAEAAAAGYRAALVGTALMRGSDKDSPFQNLRRLRGTADAPS